MAVKSRISSWSDSQQDEDEKEKSTKYYSGSRISMWNEGAENTSDLSNLASVLSTGSTPAEPIAKEEKKVGFFQKLGNAWKKTFSKNPPQTDPFTGKEYTPGAMIVGENQNTSEVTTSQLQAKKAQSTKNAATIEIAEIDSQINDLANLQSQILTHIQSSKKVKPIEQQTAEERAARNAEYERVNELMKQYVGDKKSVKYTTAEDFLVKVLDPDMASLKKSKNQLQSVIKNQETGASNKIADIWEEFKSGIDLGNAPLGIGALWDMANTLVEQDVEEKISKGESLTPQEKIVEKQIKARSEYEKRDLSTLQSAAQSVIPSVSAGVDFALVGGTASGLEGVAKYKELAKIATGVTFKVQGANIMEQFAQRVSDQYTTETDESGGFKLVKTGDGEVPVTAAILSVGNVWANNIVESMGGEVLDDATSPLLKPLKNKLANIPIVKNISDSKTGKVVSALLSKNIVKEAIAQSSPTGELAESFIQDQVDKLTYGKPLGMTGEEAKNITVSTLLVWAILAPLGLVGVDVSSGKKTEITSEDISKLPPVVQNEVNKLMVKDGVVTQEELESAVKTVGEKIESGEVTEQDIVDPIISTEPAEEVTAPTTTEVKDVTVYNASDGKLTEETKTYTNVLEVPTNQKDVLRMLSEEGDKIAKELLYGEGTVERDKIDYAKADYYIQKALGGKYEAIKYNNEDRTILGVEYHDLVQNKFYATSPEAAKIYLNSTRGEKYQSEDFKSFAQQVEQTPGVYSEATSTTVSKLGDYKIDTKLSPKTETFKTYKEMANLAKKYDVFLSEKFNNRGTVGTYTPEMNLVKVKGILNVSTLTHEITHRLDLGNELSSKLRNTPLANQLVEVYMKEYPAPKASASKKEKIIEGYAMLVERYTQDPKLVKSQYNDLYNKIIKPGGEYFEPIVGELIKDINQVVNVYNGLDAIDKIGASIEAEEGIEVPKKQGIYKAMDRIQEFVHNSTSIVDKLAKSKGIYDHVNDPTLWLHFQKGYEQVLVRNLTDEKAGYYTLDENSNMVKAHDFNWASVLKELDKWDPKERERFNSWLIARDQYYQYQRLNEMEAKTGMLLSEKSVLESEVASNQSLQNDLNTVNKQLEAIKEEYNKLDKTLKNNPQTRGEIDAAYKIFENNETYKDMIEKIDTLTDENLKLLSNPLVQIISPEEANKLRREHKGYSSMKRVFMDPFLMGEEASKAFKSAGTGVTVSSLKERKGGDYVIKYPIASMSVGSFEVYRKAMKQASYNMLGNAKLWTEAPDVFRTIPYTLGMERQKDVTVYYSDYKKKAMYIDPHVKDLIDTAITPTVTNDAISILRGLTRIFQKGTVANYPWFAVTNYFFLDAPTAFVYTKEKTHVPFADGVKLLAKEVASIKEPNEESRFFKEYLMFAQSQTRLGWDSQMSYQDVQKTLDNDLKGVAAITKSIQKKGNKVLDALAIPSNYSEYATRGAVYVNARLKGDNQMQALRKAGEATGSFYKMGSWKIGSLIPKARGTKWDVDLSGYVRTLPFFNPSVQVATNTIQAYADPKRRGKTIAVTAFYMAAGLGALAAINAGSDEQKRQLMDKDPEELATYLYFPKPGGKDLIKIRINNSFSIPATILNMIISDVFYRPESKQYEAKDYLNAAMTFLPEQANVFQPTRWFLSMLPHTIATNMAIILNKRTWPEVSDLEPSYMENIAAQDRVFSTTSAGAKLIGKMFKVSPIKVDAFIEGNLGRMMRFITVKKGVYNPIEQLFFDKYTIYGSKDLEEMKARGEELDSTLKAYKEGGKQLTAEEVVKLEAEKKAVNEVTKMITGYSDLISSKNDEEAQKMLPEIFARMDAIKAGNYDLSEDTMKELEKEYKKQAKAEIIYNAGYPEVTYFAFDYDNDKRLRILQNMYKTDPTKADKFYKLINEAGLVSSQFKKMIQEQGL